MKLHRLFTRVFVVFLFLPGFSKAQEGKGLYVQWPAVFVTYTVNHPVEAYLQDFNDDRPWIGDPFNPGSLGANVRIGGWAIGYSFGAAYVEIGSNDRRKYYEAYSLDTIANADDVSQVVRLRMSGYYLGGGVRLLNGNLALGAAIERGKYQLSTYTIDRTLRFNRRTNRFNDALVNGVDVNMTYLNLHVQIRPKGRDANGDQLLAGLAIEPFWLIGLSEVDHRTFPFFWDQSPAPQGDITRPTLLGVKCYLFVGS